MRNPTSYRSARRNAARDQKSSTMLKFRHAPSYGASARMRRSAVARLKVDGNGRPVPQHGSGP